MGCSLALVPRGHAVVSERSRRRRDRQDRALTHGPAPALRLTFAHPPTLARLRSVAAICAVFMAINPAAGELSDTKKVANDPQATHQHQSTIGAVRMFQ